MVGLVFRYLCNYRNFCCLGTGNLFRGGAGENSDHRFLCSLTSIYGSRRAQCSAQACSSAYGGPIGPLLAVAALYVE